MSAAQTQPAGRAALAGPDPAAQAMDEPAGGPKLPLSAALGYAGAVTLHVVLAAGIVLTLLPLLWTFFSSFKSLQDIFTYPPVLLPSPWTLQGYGHLFNDFPFWQWVVNSLGTAVVGTVVGVFFCALAGYGFSKYQFRGKQFLFGVLLSSMMVPIAVLIIPLFVIISRIGWSGSYQALIVPWLAPAFGVFMMRQFITQAVPDEILDAGRMDGATEFGLFWRLVVPVSRPALAALAIWLFLNIYNNFLWPLIVMTTTSKYTLPVGLASILSAQGIQHTDYAVVMAGAILAAAPTLVLFIVLRKQFIQGLTLGSVKG